MRDLLESSVIFRGLLSTLVLGTTAALIVNQSQVPPEWWAIVGMTSAYFFQGANNASLIRATGHAVRGGGTQQ